MTATARLRAAYARIEEVDRPEVWIALRAQDDALADAARVDDALEAGQGLPLAGLTLAVKDNIDVAGMPTTAGCPAFAYEPTVDAPVVAALRAAGAVVVGKTNMDQFATGLVGTRTPFGAVRDARRPDRVAGGSSAGSAVAVALGIADLALGTDTAGSGRVPAAFQGIVGLKPTRGLVPMPGVVPACRTLDCVTVFARELAEAEEAMAVMARPEPADPLSRSWPEGAPLAAPPAPWVAVPAELPELGGEERAAFAAAAARLEAAGAALLEIDLTPFLEVAPLLYQGGFVAERFQSVGAFVKDHPAEVDPTVGAIISAAESVPAHQLVEDGATLDRLRGRALDALARCDALLVPTVPFQPTIAAVQADPVEINSRLGTYTNFCNLLDLSAAAVPAGTAGGSSFGVTVLARAFADRVVCDVARLLVGGPEPAARAEPAGHDLFVVGAHLSGGPLNGQLVDRGARLLGESSTAPTYRLYALDTEPPKPGLVRTAEGGESIAGELWRLPAAGLGSLLDALPAPMSLGPVRLADGREVVGFGCDAVATDGARDITDHGGWRAYQLTGSSPARSAASAVGKP